MESAFDLYLAVVFAIILIAYLVFTIMYPEKV